MKVGDNYINLKKNPSYRYKILGFLTNLKKYLIRKISEPTDNHVANKTKKNFDNKPWKICRFIFIKIL